MASRLQKLLITNPELAYKISAGTANWGLEEIAGRLDGVTSGLHRVLCPSPGRPWDDRSMCVIFNNPGRPSSFYVYAVEGEHDVAEAYIRQRLKLLPDEPPADYSKLIREIWEETAPAPGTVVERYLRSRGITLPIPASLRYHPKLYHSETGRYFSGMVAARTGPQGNLLAIHRTYLTDSGRKAAIDPDRKDLGVQRHRGTGILLAPIAEEMLVGEGIETVLSGMQMSGIPGIACGVAKGLEGLLLPPVVRRVRVLIDGDDAGKASARRARARWFRERRQVAFVPAPPGKDFNDLLLAEGRTHA
jgi:hypothetical protein